MSVSDERQLLLSTEETIGAIREADLLRRFGGRAERIGDGYRVGNGDSNEWEMAYDFHFENGRLVSMDYWIGC